MLGDFLSICVMIYHIVLVQSWTLKMTRLQNDNRKMVPMYLEVL